MINFFDIADAHQDTVWAIASWVWAGFIVVFVVLVVAGLWAGILGARDWWRKWRNRRNRK